MSAFKIVIVWHINRPSVQSYALFYPIFIHGWENLNLYIWSISVMLLIWLCFDKFLWRVEGLWKGNQKNKACAKARSGKSVNYVPPYICTLGDYFPLLGPFTLMLHPSNLVMVISSALCISCVTEEVILNL